MAPFSPTLLSSRFSTGEGTYWPCNFHEAANTNPTRTRLLAVMSRTCAQRTFCTVRMRARQWSHTTTRLFLAMRNPDVSCRVKPCGAMPGRATLTPPTQRAQGPAHPSKQTSSQQSGRSRHDHLRTDRSAGSTHKHTHTLKTVSVQYR